MEMKLQAAQMQKLALTQSMRQSLTFLQLPAVDLSQAVREAALSNPLLEVTEPDFGRAAVDVSRPEEDRAPVFQESELWSRYAPPERRGGPAGAGAGGELFRVPGGSAGDHPLPGSPAAGALPLPHRLPELRRIPGLPPHRAGGGTGCPPL